MPSAALRLPLQELDDAGGEAAGLGVGREAGEHAVADARRARLAAPRLRLRRDDDARRGSPFLVPFDRHADRLALVVDAFDGEHGDRGQVARAVDMLAPAVDQAVVGHVLQQALQADPLRRP